MGQIIFVTGTDTQVGKTLLTGLLVVHLRQRGQHALAMKPFCSGSRTDVMILARAQDHEIDLGRINPFYFHDPVAPLVAARRVGRTVKIAEVLTSIRSLAAQCEILLVEGAGGVLVPLGFSYSVADLISRLGCPVLLVARNRLGAVNHTLLSLAVLRSLGILRTKVVLMDTARSDLASQTNAGLISTWASSHKVLRIPFLGPTAVRKGALQQKAALLRKILAQILKMDNFSAACGEGLSERKLRQEN